MPKTKTMPVIKTEQLVNKEVIENPALPSPLVNQETQEPEEKIVSFENDKLKVLFSSVGGIIKNIEIKEYNFSLPVTDFLEIKDLAKAAFSIDKTTENQISFSLQNDNFEVKRNYSLKAGDYIIQSETEIINKMSKLDKRMSGFKLDISRLDNISNNHDRSLFEYTVAATNQEYRKANAFQFKPKDSMILSKNIEWIGFRDRYFCVLIKPVFSTESFSIEPLSDKILDISFKPAETDDKEKLEAIIYCGPQKYNLLKSYGVGLENIMKFSNWGLLDAVAKTIYNIMSGIHKFIPNWGICIILISLLIYGVMYPLTIKSLSSMKKMQTLQPKINQLREQYKNSPQKLNKEIMELYKEHKANPLGGCLPIVFQMPVFIGLYQVLWRSVEFKGSHFLWIKDLSEPDRLFILPYNLMFIGNEINILPIIMMCVMVFQQKLTSSSMVITDETQRTQQKMMMFLFPVMIGFFFYKMASGLCLYFTLFYALSTLTQLKIAKMHKTA